ncbi:MAG: hypothetical protein ABFS23_02575 [Pseudomonadota bacterium]
MHLSAANIPEGRERLREEIAYLEARLVELGFEGDCAYERAMARFFTERLETRRAQLADRPVTAAAISSEIPVIFPG